MLIYLVIIFGIYFGFLLVSIRGWIVFASPARSDSEKVQEFVSIVIAVRNEEHSITHLLDSLLVQEYPLTQFEVILVDDHSHDHTQQVISDWMQDHPTVTGYFLNAIGKGKKQALTTGIKQAKGEIILTTDADCMLPVDWIVRMVNSFTIRTSMVIGLVKIQTENSLFSKLQALEFSSLMGSSMALHALGYPIMCNGANLGFRKSRFEEVNGYEGNLHIPSGDDEFLMRKLNGKFPGSIQSVRWPSMLVTTHPQSTLKNFIQQRLRWASKWKTNDSFAAKALAAFILAFQISHILALYLILKGDDWLIVSVLVGIKMILEAIYLSAVGRYMHQRLFLSAFLLLQVVYSFYVVIIGLLSQLLDYEWKDRKDIATG